MAEAAQVMTTLQNRIKAMINNEMYRKQPGLMQQLEEIGFLIEMLEPKIPPMQE